MEEELVFSAFERGTCINCGFLFQINHNIPGEHQLTMLQRNTGYLPTRNDLHCFRRAKNLLAEVTIAQYAVSQRPDWFARVPGDNYRHTAVREVIEKDRKCGSFYAWVEHMSPQWHYDAWRDEIAEQERRNHDLRMAALEQESRKSLEKIAAAQRDISSDHLEFVKISDRQTAQINKRTVLFNWAFLLLALAALVLALGSLAYPNGASWLEWFPGQSSAQTQLPNTAASPLAPTS